MSFYLPKAGPALERHPGTLGTGSMGGGEGPIGTRVRFGWSLKLLRAVVAAQDVLGDLHAVPVERPAARSYGRPHSRGRAYAVSDDRLAEMPRQSRLWREQSVDLSRQQA